jgi:hypothetical protein
MSAHPLLVQSIKSALAAAGQTGLALPSLRRHEASRTRIASRSGVPWRSSRMSDRTESTSK